MKFTAKSKIRDVINDPAFGSFGRLLFPLQRNYMQGASLGTMKLSWYTNICPDDTVAVINHLWSQASAGETIFYDIYTEEEKLADPTKRDTGLFLFRGRSGGKVAILNAGGGFRYVGAMHDSFPHALALSEKGIHAFALIYRPGGETSCRDLARAVAFVHENAAALQADVSGYSLWGGSAGARTAAMLGALGTARFGEKNYPKPAAVIMQYTGFADIYGSEPPTYSCAGANDGPGLRRAMKKRTEAIRQTGTDAEFEVFDDLAHGFGLGTGTAAEGWIDRAVQFWERQTIIKPENNTVRGGRKMDAYEAIITRRSTRKYKPATVEPAILQKVIEAGRYAPSGGNNQTNHFIVVQDAEVLAKITSLAEAAFAKMTVDQNTYPSLRNSILASKKGGYVFSYHAPALIIVANRKDYGNNMADSVAAIENMMIAANALDLGSCYINQLYWLNEEPSLLSCLQELGMKENERVYASMTLGYAATEDGLPNRKPLERKGNEVTFV